MPKLTEKQKKDSVLEVALPKQWAAYHFDPKSGCRERLFLLSQISLKADNPANYTYSPKRDCWIHTSNRELEVTYEAGYAIDNLASRGINLEDALELVGYPQAKVERQ